MGQFYNTAQPTFVEDIMYQPPWEMLQAALGKQQNDYDLATAQANAFTNVPVDFIDDPIERAKVQEKQDYYNSKAQELSTKLQQGDMNSWRRALPEITQLGRELDRDYKTGDISKIQESSKNYKGLLEHLKTIKDPSMRADAKKYYMKEWQKNEGRSLDSTFKYEDVFDKQDPTGEFLKELEKYMPADKFAEAKAYTDGKYIHTTKNTTEIKADVDKAYEQFIKAKGYEPYFKQEQNFGRGSYFGEDGKLKSFTDQTGSLYDQAQYVKNAEFSNTTSSKDLSVDQYGILARQEAATIRAENRAAISAKAAELGTPEIGKVSNKLLEISDALQNQQDKLLTPLLAKYKLKGGKGDYSMQDLKKHILSNPTSVPTSIYKEVKKVEDAYNKNFVASKQQLVNTFGTAATDRFLGSVDKNWLNSTKVHLAVGDLDSAQSTPFSIEDYNNPKKPMQIGNKRVLSAKYIGKEVLPILIGADIKDAMLQKQIEFEFEDGSKRTIPVYTKAKDFTQE